MTAPGRIAGTLMLAAALIRPAARSPQQRSTFAAGTDVVTVDVSVREHDKPVPNLTAADFVVTDNGVPQTVQAVSTDGLPVDVTLVLDTSGSVEPMLDGLLGQVDDVGKLLRAQDGLRLLAFAGSVSELFPMGPPPATIPIDGLTAGGGTAMYDALAMALMRPRRPDRAEIVVALTDGVDTASAMTLSQLRELTARSDSVLFVFLLRSTASVLRCVPRGVNPAPVPVSCNPSGLTGLAESTGGVVFTVGAGPEIVRAMETALATFRSSYTLRYTARGVTAAGWHEIHVRLARPGSFAVRARAGYRGN